MASVSRSLQGLAHRLARAPRGSVHSYAAPLMTSGLMALLAAFGCSSELRDGNPGMSGGLPNFADGLGPDGNPIQGGGNAGGSSNPIDTGTDNELGTPMNVVNSQADRDRTLGGTGDTGALTDEFGNPLAVNELPGLNTCRTPGPRLIRRLTSQQYQNTLQRVLGQDNVPDSPLVDTSTLGYNVDVDDNLVQGVDAQALNGLAETVAANARTNNFFQGVANCNQLNDDCQRRFIQNLGERLSREPLDNERVNRFMELFDLQVDGIDLVESFDDGAELVVAAMIQSPYLLYRRELGVQQGGEYQLTGFEIASELSYFLTNSPPDDELMQAAGSQQLSTPEQIGVQVERLLATPEAQEVLARFALQWLDVDDLFDKAKDGGDLPENIRDAMLQETETLFLEVLASGAPIGELFSANYTYVNQDLASHYGLTGVTGQGFQRVELAGSQRAMGVLGHGSYLAEHALVDNSSPVQRAFVVRERLLCNALPDPPNDLDTNLDPQNPAETSRERYAQHSANAVCAVCHVMMDPIGFSFENYDAFGQFRATEGELPIDSSGELALMNDRGLDGKVVPLAGVTDLAAHLSQSEQARACIVNNLSYLAYGVANETKWPFAAKVCNDHAIRQVARDSGNSLRSVITGIVTAPHFTRRVQDI